MRLFSSLLLRAEIVKVVLLLLLLLLLRLLPISLPASLWWAQVVEVVLVFLLNMDLALVGLVLVVLAVRRILREVAVLCRLCCLACSWVRSGIVHACSSTAAILDRSCVHGCVAVAALLCDVHDPGVRLLRIRIATNNATSTGAVVASHRCRCHGRSEHVHQR